jgi:hypothetical protein
MAVLSRLARWIARLPGRLLAAGKTGYSEPTGLPTGFGVQPLHLEDLDKIEAERQGEREKMGRPGDEEPPAASN